MAPAARSRSPQFDAAVGTLSPLFWDLQARRRARSARDLVSICHRSARAARPPRSPCSPRSPLDLPAGHTTTLLTMLKGLPTAYNKDMQEDKEARPPPRPPSSRPALAPTSARSRPRPPSTRSTRRRRRCRSPRGCWPRSSRAPPRCARRRRWVHTPPPPRTLAGAPVARRALERRVWAGRGAPSQATHAHDTHERAAVRHCQARC